MSSHDRAQNSIQSPVAIPANVIAQCVLPRAPGTDVSSEDLQMGEHLTHCQEEFDGLQGLCQAAGNQLTDDALLDIFDSYLNDSYVSDRLQNVNKWHTLVHVCRRWRDLVFASPRRLNLRLLCRKATPVREMLDIWPALPIEIEDIWMSTGEAGQDNIIAALEHPDRVRSITLSFVQRETLVLPAATQHMQVPFPELTSLRLWSSDRSARILPDSFLGGSAPRLRTLHLSGIPFPAVPNLLLSASDLVHLALERVPHSGYISPAAMVACLSSLNSLKSLDLGFESPQPRPDRPSRPPQTRVVLPALTSLSFTGMTDYSEDFLTRIDTPVLNNLSMSSSPDLVLGVPHFKNFISRTKCLKPPKGARVCLNRWCIPLALTLHQQHGPILEVMCGRIELVTLICGQLSPFFSLIERLYFFVDHSPFKPQGEDNIESTQLVELFRPFTAVRSLHVSKSLVPLVATALQVLIGPRATEVLPNLCDIFLGGSVMPGTVPEAMQPFVTARQLSGQPVAVHHWEGVEADQ